MRAAVELELRPKARVVLTVDKNQHSAGEVKQVHVLKAVVEEVRFLLCPLALRYARIIEPYSLDLLPAAQLVLQPLELRAIGIRVFFGLPAMAYDHDLVKNLTKKHLLFSYSYCLQHACVLQFSAFGQGFIRRQAQNICRRKVLPRAGFELARGVRGGACGRSLSFFVGKMFLQLCESLLQLQLLNFARH